MSALTQLGRLLLIAGVGALVLAPAAVAEGASESTGASAPATPPAETSSTSTAASPQAETLTVEPAPTPPPAAPRSRPSAAPRVSTQHPQRASAGKGAHAKSPTSASTKAGGAPAQAQNGPRAPSPSAVTPPLPLVFSASLSGIPGFFIESFRVPPFLLPIFQAAGTAYGVPWQVLAAINEVETDYGRDLSVSSAGAEGWMQFLPSSWATYGVDANGDGFKDPYNPADAIFAAARYLRAAGAATDLPGAIFAYNHSHAYVESVLLRARLLGGTPSELLGALTGLTQGRFPVHAPAHFSDGFPAAPGGSGPAHTLAGTTIYSEAGAPVIAVQDGLVTRVGSTRELGRFVSLRDAYGNTYTYAQLGRTARFYPVLAPHEAPVATAAPAAGSGGEERPSAPASAGVQPRAQAPALEGGSISGPLGGGATLGTSGAEASLSTSPAGAPGAGANAAPAPRSTPVRFRAGPNDVYLHALHAGVRVIAGTVLGHLGSGAGAPSGEGAPHMLFQIRPSGAGAPLIDPKPILDGWVQLEKTSVYHAGGANPFLASEPSAGQALLESKQQLEQQILASHRISGRCAREAVQAGQVDRRVLAALEFLAVSGLKPTVSGVPCPSGSPAAEPGPAAQTSDQAAEIVAVNGSPTAAAQGGEALATSTLAKLRGLQGPLRPRVLAVRTRGVEVNFAQPRASVRVPTGRAAGALAGGITPTQWIQLIARLGEIPSPTVHGGPSAASIPDRAGAGNTGAAHGNG
ncbi:MAG TPA: lytic murein transglycosylase [Solirubrobacteraceae bacterium]|nr:lytic murein transglycosylase [Solirubrobacteraceae bacterium]